MFLDKMLDGFHILERMVQNTEVPVDARI